MLVTTRLKRAAKVWCLHERLRTDSSWLHHRFVKVLGLEVVGGGCCRVGSTVRLLHHFLNFIDRCSLVHL